ncbi:AraC family transcriptional regulator [Roseococcus sp. SDR]|uniref:AraC family transcriptional regulator n=1 Tax=Roseococcus sp. SDR TaxID=2835532 RepID=UPI001BCE8851|nr:AraC family transcriptional regulator [Roseococcus sp. SDR]MBS7789775.1 helix-turn-helix transcriptional regulator [Roseococcus sp. SDR]MBV1845089.1 AraC family transcriptional regulator [Roseococcus sp. SDR]
MVAPPSLPAPKATETALASLADVYGDGCYARFLQAHRRIGMAPLALVRFRQPAGAFPDPPTADYTLAINERGRGRMVFDIGAGRHSLPFRPGDLVLKPPGVATHFAMDGPHQKSFLSLPARLVTELMQGAAGPDGAAPDFGALHHGSFRAPAIARLMELIWAEAAENNPHGRLFSEGAAMALVAMMLRLRRPRSASQPEVRPLAQPRLRAVLDWIEANLSESFGLTELAAVACLSPHHFSRAFKAAMGETPRAHVTTRRIERAKEYLEDRDLPLAEIAQLCGFADQAHFTALFGRRLGMTPGAWRRARG